MKCLETRGKKVQHPGQEDHRVDAPLGRVLQGGGSTALDDDIVHLPAVQSLAATCYFCLHFTINM